LPTADPTHGPETSYKNIATIECKYEIVSGLSNLINYLYRYMSQEHVVYASVPLDNFAFAMHSRCSPDGI